MVLARGVICDKNDVKMTALVCFRIGIKVKMLEKDKIRHKGSGCGSVGKPVASDTRDPWFESSLWQTLYFTFNVNCIEKTKI